MGHTVYKNKFILELGEKNSCPDINEKIRTMTCMFFFQATTITRCEQYRPKYSVAEKAEQYMHADIIKMNHLVFTWEVYAKSFMPKWNDFFSPSFCRANFKDFILIYTFNKLILCSSDFPNRILDYFCNLNCTSTSNSDRSGLYSRAG